MQFEERERGPAVVSSSVFPNYSRFSRSQCPTLPGTIPVQCSSSGTEDYLRLDIFDLEEIRLLAVRRVLPSHSPSDLPEATTFLGALEAT